jgi:hypothetical protein
VEEFVSAEEFDGGWEGASVDGEVAEEGAEFRDGEVVPGGVPGVGGVLDELGFFFWGEGLVKRGIRSQGHGF